MQARSAFEAIRGRHTAYSFSSRRIPDQLLYELLDLANTAPSGFNLQPWHFIVVRDSDLKEVLAHVALEQEQVNNAPYTVVFAADPLAWREPYDEVLRKSISAGSLDEERAALYRRQVTSFFSTDPCGLSGIVKRITTPLRRLFRPLPKTISSREEARNYVSAQAMLAAATFLIAAASVGIASCPIELFDEERLKKLLAVPPRMAIPLIVALGYPLEETTAPPLVRLPLLEKISIDLFPNKLIKLKKERQEN